LLRMINITKKDFIEL